VLRRQALWDECRRSQRSYSLHKPTPAEALACHLHTSHVPTPHIELLARLITPAWAQSDCDTRGSNSRRDPSCV
jgi:hypothetical protein